VEGFITVSMQQKVLLALLPGEEAVRVNGTAHL
jgi:hypothetical protein